MGIPDEKARKHILEVMCRHFNFEAGFDFQLLARLTPGYVGSDLDTLVRKAGRSLILACQAVSCFIGSVFHCVLFSQNRGRTSSQGLGHIIRSGRCRQRGLLRGLGKVGSLLLGLGVGERLGAGQP